MMGLLDLRVIFFACMLLVLVLVGFVCCGAMIRFGCGFDGSWSFFELGPGGCGSDSDWVGRELVRTTAGMMRVCRCTSKDLEKKEKERRVRVRVRVKEKFKARMALSLRRAPDHTD